MLTRIIARVRARQALQTNAVHHGLSHVNLYGTSFSFIVFELAFCSRVRWR
ncbi:MAG: hypothetical protein JWN13_6297 [Betaproteobacteria bacterium]|jgi:hypothetical protein|nr:hypothetical protein [Betaproteobacteria bacterium]MEA3154516.1 hypothetical protein [Betaproteobacteria bacterium]